MEVECIQFRFVLESITILMQLPGEGVLVCGGGGCRVCEDKCYVVQPVIELMYMLPMVLSGRLPCHSLHLSLLRAPLRHTDLTSYHLTVSLTFPPLSLHSCPLSLVTLPPFLCLF